MAEYILEAFKQFDLLEEAEESAEFSMASDDLEDMKTFIDMASGEEDEVEVFDLEAETKEELKDAYVGKVILDCNVCHSNIFYNREDIEIGEDEIANIGDECPYCMSNEGYTIIGEIKKFGEEDPEDDFEEPEDDIEDIDMEEEPTEDVEVEDEEEFMEEEYLKSSDKLAASKKLKEGCSHKDVDEADESEEIEEGLKADKSPSLKRNDSINGRKTSLKRTLDGSDEIRGPKYKELDESKKRINESIEDFEIPGVEAELLDDWEDAGHHGYEVAYTKDGEEICTAEIWDDDSPVTIYEQPSHLFNRTYDSFNAFASDMEYKLDSYFNESLKEARKNTPSKYKKTGDDLYKKNTEDVQYVVQSSLEDDPDIKVTSESEAKALIAQNKREDKKDPERKAAGITYTYKKINESLDESIDNAADMENILVNADILFSWDDDNSIRFPDEYEARKAKQTLEDKGFFVDYDPESFTMILESQKMNESIEDVSITTEDETMTMTTKEDGGVVVETSPREAVATAGEELEGEEVIAPLDMDTQEEIESQDDFNDEFAEGDFEEDQLPDDFNAEEVDMPMDDFDEESFDDLGESYLKECYENVDSFKTSTVKNSDGKLVVEGLITFNSGNTKQTTFTFESMAISKKGKVRLIGENAQICSGKKAFKVRGKVEDKKFISESLNYNYSTKNENDESVKVSGTVRRS